MKNIIIQKNVNLTAVIFAALCLVLFAASCVKTPDTETVHLYIRASDAYAQKHFAEVIELLRKQNSFPPALILRAKAEYFLTTWIKRKKLAEGR